MKNLTPELIEKAKTATSAEELLELAKAAGVEMTAAEAATYFTQLNPKSGELDDDDLDNVAGGACANSSDESLSEGTTVRVTSGQTCKKCGGNIGIVEYWTISYRAGGKGVACTNCSTDGSKYIITECIDECTYEIIG